ncbi:MAG: F0F1 ATP synthase subunit A [Anaerolineae bacterium]|nr:F0F1 ATP synthase subunit A [Anaerolineae bacterium]
MHISLKPELLFNLGSFPVTNSILTSWIGTLLLIVIAIVVGGNFKRIPAGIQHVFEMVYEMFEGMATEVMGAAGKKFVPLLATLFLFIITSNWLGVLPGVGSLGIYETHAAAPAKDTHAAPAKDAQAKPAAKDAHAAPAAKDAHAAPAKDSHAKDDHGPVFVPLFRGANADLNTTFALAIIVMVIIHVMGIKSAGLSHHLAHFKNPLEIVSEFSKILSFGFRLFGNVFAGEVLLTAMASIFVIITGNNLLAYGALGGFIVFPFLMLEFFVGFIQAFVFAMLTLSFLSLFYKTENSEPHH